MSDSPASEAARQLAQKRHSLDTYINSIVKRAPELTDEQRDRLATLIRVPDPLTTDGPESAA